MYLEDKVTVLRDTVYSSSSLFHQSVHCPSVVQLVSCENFPIPSLADNGQSWVSFFSFLLCVCVYWIRICLCGCVHVYACCVHLCGSRHWDREYLPPSLSVLLFWDGRAQNLKLTDQLGWLSTEPRGPPASTPIPGVAGAVVSSWVPSVWTQTFVFSWLGHLPRPYLFIY